MAKKDKRFVKMLEENADFMTGTVILVDRETGVNYLYVTYGQSGGLTPLLDREGRPIITPIRPEYDE
jgi:hypothetical protein